MDGYKRLSRPSLSGLSKIKADTLRVSDDVVIDTTTLIVDPDNNTVGICNANPSYPLDVVGVVNTDTAYRVGGDTVLTANTLGANVVNSSITSVGTLGSLSVSGNTAIDGTTFFVDSVNNRVGFGTTAPSYPINISTTSVTGQTLLGALAGSLASNNSAHIYLGKNSNAGNYGALSFYYLGNSGVTQANNAIRLGFNNSGTDYPSFECKYNGTCNIANGELSVSSASGTVLKGNLTVGGSANVASGQTYKIDGTDVLSATALGSSVVDSSLTSFGTLSNLKATVIQCGGTANTNANGALRFNNNTDEKICLYASSANSHYSLGVGSSSFNFNSNTGSFTFYKEGTNDEGTKIFEVDDDTVTLTQSLTLPSALPTFTSSMLGYVESSTPSDFVYLKADGTATTILSLADLPVGVWLLLGQVSVRSALDTVTVSSLNLTIKEDSTTIASSSNNLDWTLSTSADRSYSITYVVSNATAKTFNLSLAIVSSGDDTTVRTSNTATTTFFKSIRIA